MRCGFRQSKICQDFPNYTTEDIEKLSSFERWILLWFVYNSAYKRFSDQNPYICSIKFEDLLTKPEDMVSNIFKFLDIPDEKLPNVNKVKILKQEVNIHQEVLTKLN